MPGILRHLSRFHARPTKKRDPMEFDIDTLIRELKAEVKERGVTPDDIRAVINYIDYSEFQPNLEIPAVASIMRTKLYPEMNFQSAADVLEVIKQLRINAAEQETPSII